MPRKSLQYVAGKGVGCLLLRSCLHIPEQSYDAIPYACNVVCLYMSMPAQLYALL